MANPVSKNSQYALRTDRKLDGRDKRRFWIATAF